MSTIRTTFLKVWCVVALSLAGSMCNVAVAAGTYSSNFDLVENPLSEGGVWRRAVNNHTNVRSSGGVAFGTNGITNEYDDSYALLSGFAPDQTIEAVVQRSSSLNTNVTHEAELLLRFSDSTSGARGYECLFAFYGQVQIVRWNGRQGDYTFPSSTAGQGSLGRELRTGDVIKATISGNVISAYINGTLMARVTDSAYTTGQPGIGFFTRPGGNSAHLALTQVSASSEGAASPAPVVTLSASPTSVASGGTTALTWSSTNATSCTASGAWSGTRATAGSANSAALSSNPSSFTLTCTGAGGQASRTVDVTVTSPTPSVPVVTLSASPTSVAPGGTTSLTWSSTNATSCAASGAWSGTRSTAGSATSAALSSNPSSFTLTCTGPGGQASRTVNVTVASPPVVTLSASPTSVAPGGTTSLTWSSTNATSCAASGAWSGTRSTAGSATSAALSSNPSSFTLTCTGPGGQASRTVNVTVASPPVVTLSASPTSVAPGASTALTWSSTNATSCVASGEWSGTRATAGSENSAPLSNSTSAFTLTCTGAGGQASRTVNVAVTAGTPSSGSYSSNFDLEENPLNESGVWRRAANNFTNVRSSGGVAFGTNGITNGYDDSYALLSGFAADQTVEAVVQRSSSLNTNVTHNAELLLRFSDSTSGARGYECLFAFYGQVQVKRWNGRQGDTTYLSSTAGPGGLGRDLRTGDVLKASISGSVFSCHINGTLMARATDSTYATGQPGVGFFIRPGGNSAHLAFTRVTATSQGTSSPSPGAPVVTLSASPTSVAAGGTTALTWSATDATSCSASGAWSGTRATAGSENSAALSASPSSFTLTCTGPGGQASRTVNVTVAAAAPPSSGSYSSNFDLEENPLSEAGVWRRAVNNHTNVKSSAGVAHGTNGVTNTYDDSYALLSGFGPNQTVEAVVQRSPSLNTSVTHEAELLLRFSDSTSGARGYECLFAFYGGVQVVRWNGTQGDYTVLPSTAGTGSLGRELLTGDVIKASISGNVIDLHINGTLVMHATDSAFATGQPGIGFFTRPGGNSAHLALTRITASSQ